MSDRREEELCTCGHKGITHTGWTVTHGFSLPKELTHHGACAVSNCACVRFTLLARSQAR